MEVTRTSSQSIMSLTALSRLKNSKSTYTRSLHGKLSQRMAYKKWVSSKPKTSKNSKWP